MGKITKINLWGLDFCNTTFTEVLGTETSSWPCSSGNGT